MIDTFLKLESSDKIQIISIVSTTMISIISVIISVLTLRQTNKITKEANRPYLAIYQETIQVTSTLISFLVVKNFGTTGAVIDSISYEPDFTQKYNSRPFLNLTNHFIAPNQSLTTACEFLKPYKPVTFTVKYHNGKTSYKESFIINPEANAKLTYAKSTPGNSTNLEKIIAHSAQELIRTKL